MAKNSNAWFEVKNNILKLAEDFESEGDMKLPPELALSEMYGVSRSTVREALAKLIQEGIVYRIHGKGSFIRRGLSRLNLDITKLYSVTDAIRNVNRIPSTILLSKNLIPADVRLAEKLNIEIGEMCLEIERLRFADKEVAVYNRNYFIQSALSGATHDDLKHSIFDFFHRSGLSVSYARSKIKSSVLTKEQIPELNSEIQAFLLLEEIYYQDNGNVLGYTNDYYSDNIFSFEVIRNK